MAKNGGTTDAVRKLNLHTLEWSDLPKLPSSNMIKGFGSAAINLNGQLVVGAFSYNPKVFVEANSTWVQSKAKMKEKRFLTSNVDQKIFFVGRTREGLAPQDPPQYSFVHCNSLIACTYNSKCKK